jgi:septal ring factor EnvC (AmiA/AmiB activator)
MSEKAARQPMTNWEREILFQMQKLFAKWLDTVHMCLDREANHRQRIEELAQNVQDLKQEIQELKQQLAKDRLF